MKKQAAEMQERHEEPAAPWLKAEIAAGMVPPGSGDAGILRAAIGEAQDKLGRAYALFTGEYPGRGNETKEPGGGGGLSARRVPDAAGTVAPGGYGAELGKKEA